MNIIIDALVVIMLAFVASSATLFIDFCIGEPSKGKPASGRIFSIYGLWLSKKYKRRNMYIEELKAQLEDKGRIEQMEYRVKNWYKPLGMCPICTNPYITAIVFLVGDLLFRSLYDFNLPYVWIIPCMVISNTFFRLTWSKLI